MANTIEPPISRHELRKIPERPWLKSDRQVALGAFYPFKDFYGGYLVYVLKGRKYKQWIGNATARKLGVKEIYMYGQRAYRRKHEEKVQT